MKRYEINYNNDVYFKHLLSANDEDSERLRRTIITEQFHINYEQLIVKNPEILPEYLDGKKPILDILLQNEKGEEINLEMQVSTVNEFQLKRFQFYGTRKLSEQLESGDDYDKLNKVYQIIFLTDALNKNHFIDSYTSKNEYGEEEKNNLIHRYYVNMPYINKIAIQKGIGEFTDFEKMVYVYQNNLEFDILNVEKGIDCNLNEDPIVKIMVNKMSDLKVDHDLRAYALSAEMGRAQYEYEQRVLKELREEIEKTKEEVEKNKKENEKVREENEKVKEENEKVKEENEKTKESLKREREEFMAKQYEIIKTIMIKFDCTEDKAKEILQIQ